MQDLVLCLKSTRKSHSKSRNHSPLGSALRSPKPTRYIMSLGSSGNASIRRPRDVYYGAESTVLRSSLSILPAVLVTV